MTGVNQYAFQQYQSLEFLARQVVEGFIIGLHKSPFHGFSVEFAEHRLYNTGESIKHVDWKLYGKTDKLFVKKYEEETNLRCQVIVDNSSSMYFPVQEQKGLDFPNKITYAVHCAAVLMYLLRMQRDAAGLTIFSDSIELHTPCKSTAVHNKGLIIEMEKLLTPIGTDVRKATRTAQVLHQIADSIHKRSLVVLLSDMLGQSSSNEEIFSALQHLKYNKHEVIVFHVADRKKEIDFEYESRPHRFIDMETGAELKLNPVEVQSHYQASVAGHHREIKLKCAQYKIDLVPVDISQDLKDILMPFLMRRRKMY